MSKSRWGRLVLGGLVLAGSVWLMRQLGVDDTDGEAHPEPDVSGEAAGAPSGEASGSPSDGVEPPAGGRPPLGPHSRYFEMPESERNAILIRTLKESGNATEIERSAEEQGRIPDLHADYVRLLSLKDPEMFQATHDRLTTFTGDGKITRERVAHRVDDTLFKERLLYILRTQIPSDSRLLEGIMAAYGVETDPMTRMRIVRAVAKIGAHRAQEFLEKVVEAEGEERTPASQEARIRLEELKRA